MGGTVRVTTTTRPPSGVASRPVYAAPPVVYTAPPPVVYQPAPVVVYQPAPVCTSYWVNPSWTGYQWVPGYWAQACLVISLDR